MAIKKLEINLTPQNNEWIGLIPNPGVNIDIVFNKLIEMGIDEGLLLEVISNSLTVSDLAKFKTTYSKMQIKRNAFLDDLDIQVQHSEKIVKTKVDTHTTTIAPKETIQVPPKSKSGWDEDSF